jgi:hypothetical protein
MYRDAYVDAVPQAQIETATELALRLYRKQPGWGLKRCVILAVQHDFCPCVTGVPAMQEPGLGVMQEAIDDEVLRRVERALAAEDSPANE